MANVVTTIRRDGRRRLAHTPVMDRRRREAEDAGTDNLIILRTGSPARKRRTT